MKPKIYLLFVFALISFKGYSQNTKVQNGVLDVRDAYFALKNCTIHINGNSKIENGILLIHNDKIEDVGIGISIPKGAIEIDLKGKHIYPSFIDLCSKYGIPDLPTKKATSYYNGQIETETIGAFASNQAIKSENDAFNVFKTNEKAAEEIRKSGFGLVVSHNQDGIFRGTGALISLANKSESQSLILPKITSNYSLDKGTSTQSYPFSVMGAVALFRQSLYDADWYKKGGNKLERNISLEKFNENEKLEKIFNAKSVYEIFRIQKVSEEFKIPFIIKSNGDEYQMIEDLKNTKSSFIVPINFPKPFDVDDAFDTEIVRITDLKHWELAPSNLGILAKNNINFCITSDGLEKQADFLINLRKAVEFGLDSSIAINALTTIPAKLIKIEDKAGAIKKGLFANFIITNQNILKEDAKILENWILGEKYTISKENSIDIRGFYNVNLTENNKVKLFIEGTIEKPTAEIGGIDSAKIKTQLLQDNSFVTLNFKDKKNTNYRIVGHKSLDKLEGEWYGKDGIPVLFTATKFDSVVKFTKKDTIIKRDTIELGKIWYPFTAFGNEKKPKSEDFIIKNINIWTNEADGNFIGDVMVKNGKIEQVAKDIPTGKTKTIDGTNRYLTNGIIDEHSHIALFSINDVESVSSQVRQEDALDDRDVDIYRQLAGGVTTSQLLHGSADCIGGQSAIIKLKWGNSPNNLIIPNSPKFIKFALGENVKRGNSPIFPNRYPASRMGVEQTFLDAFNQAKEYKKALGKAKTDANTLIRKNIKLDALVEILDGKRNISCHSYVQSEINMLMQLADSLGFKINTFTHILEGYKVADKMKNRNINASTFSDWWAYKMEVKEAIPYNAAILTKVGVNTAINSDDAEMARRLNQEAAKTILYGGLSEIEAWKTVTLNPAKMLHLDDRLGSIKKGKDADLVIWSDNPLSIYAKPLKTIIDGTVYFDIDQNEIKNKELKQEKNRIIQKMINEKKMGKETVKPIIRVKTENNCETLNRN